MDALVCKRVEKLLKSLSTGCIQVVVVVVGVFMVVTVGIGGVGDSLLGLGWWLWL